MNFLLLTYSTMSTIDVFSCGDAELTVEFAVYNASTIVYNSSALRAIVENCRAIVEPKFNT